MIAMKNQVYCKILTKIANYNIDRFINNNFIRNGIWAKPENFKKYVAFGFTLTGHDELEPGASTNDERIKAMRKLHDAGFKTFCSAEPIIDFESSKDVMCSAMDCCDLYKIGLESGKKYDKNDLKSFVDWVLSCNRPNNPKFYFKDSLLKSAGISRSELPDNCITKDYDIFNNK
jgi:DNA repair photolyase